MVATWSKACTHWHPFCYYSFFRNLVVLNNTMVSFVVNTTLRVNGLQHLGVLVGCFRLSSQHPSFLLPIIQPSPRYHGAVKFAVMFIGWSVGSSFHFSTWIPVHFMIHSMDYRDTSRYWAALLAGLSVVVSQHHRQGTSESKMALLEAEAQ